MVVMLRREAQNDESKKELKIGEAAVQPKISLISRIKHGRKDNQSEKSAFIDSGTTC